MRYFGAAIALMVLASVSWAAELAPVGLEDGEEALATERDGEVVDFGASRDGGHSLPERALTLDLTDPLLDYEANSRIWQTLNEVSGRLNDTLGVRSGMDASPAGRVALTLGAAWFSRGWQYYSHEIAHDNEDRENGLRTGFALDWSSFEWGWPRYVQVQVSASTRYAKESPTEVFKSRTAGLNQDELNARAAWLSSSLSGALNTQNAVAFLNTKLLDIFYYAYAGPSDARPPTTRIPMRDVDTFAVANGMWNDIDLYLLYLNNWDIKLEKQDYLAQILIADLLSWHTWENLRLIGGYLRTGARSAPPATWTLTGSLAVSPPLLTTYVTRDGTFCNISSILSPGGDRPLLVSLGTDLDFIGDGKVDRFRLGAQYHNLGWSRARLAPFVYVNTSRADGYEGASVGVEGSVTLTAKIDFRFKVEHNEGDVVENIVKGKDEGFGARLGIDVRF